MKKLYKCAFIIVLLLFCFSSYAQIVTLEPTNPSGEDEIKVIFDATEGNGELEGAAKVYMHSGVVIEGPDSQEWEYVQGTWGTDNGVGEMTPVAGEAGKWEITLSPSARAYYAVPDGITIFRLSMVFRNETGTTKATITSGDYAWGQVASNGDFFIDLQAGAYVNITSPTTSQVYVNEGESFAIQATASAEVSAMTVFVEEAGVFVEKYQVTSGIEISYNYLPTSTGNLTFKVSAVIAGLEVESQETVNVIIKSAPAVAALPTGLIKGINYHENDATKATLVLEAPGKEFAFVVGDFTNWEVWNDYQMTKTPDGEIFWLELSGLEAGKEYVFQYWVEEAIKIGDPYADKVVDPWNDQYIPESVYPNIINYDKTDYHMATVLQTAQAEYQWASSESTWEKPLKEDLVIYEVLLRDFLASHSYQDLTDTLLYLKRLGINAIELMPIMEFEGNDSWGYNPAYFFAPDKYYGTKDDLKKFIETAHQQGIAVILDMVLNHAFGQNAMVKLNWDGTNNTVTEDSPWFNPVAKHPYNVGFDFNHESNYTKSFVDSVNHYWLDEYHFDGYRFDLSKGFTQNFSNTDGGFSAYDASRVALLKRMADEIWNDFPEAYVILEHFAHNTEEKELAEYRAEEGLGMMLWGNLNHAYNQNTMGYGADSKFDWISADTRGWEVPHVVGYMESHDEERLVYKNIAFGNAAGSYDVTDTATAVSRIKAAGLMFYTLPGPKMIWQFGELGYDYSINRCPDGTIGDCRLSPKPPRWDYYNRNFRKDLYDHTADLLRLRNEHSVFTSGSTTFFGDNSLVKQVSLENEIDTGNPSSAEEMSVHMVSNFELTTQNIEVLFPYTGTWYDYYNGGEAVEVANVSHKISLGAGEYKLYTNYPIEAPVISGIINLPENEKVVFYPNPMEDILTIKFSRDPIENLSLHTVHGYYIAPLKVGENKWDVSHLSPGLYLVNIKIEEKNYTSKLIKK